MKRTHRAVTLRERTMPSGNVSLYLDIYYKGVRKYEYLKLYLVPERTREDKAENRKTRQLAETIAAKRLAEVTDDIHGIRRAVKVRYCDLYTDYAENKSASTRRQYVTKISMLKNWSAWERDVASIDQWDIAELRRMIEADTDNGTTRQSYWIMTKAVFNEAIRMGIIDRMPSGDMKGYKKKASERVYLTIDELKQMAATPFKFDYLKRAFIFSCLTGLRASDIERLRWQDVEGTRITFRQKKTGSQEYLDITPQAFEWMGERGEGRIFSPFYAKCTNNTNYLRRWAKSAGIEKPLTFHSGRHTFATMMLTLDVDLYTVSKLLGHSNITTTQIYAKVIDKKKYEAVNRIPKI